MKSAFACAVVLLAALPRPASGQSVTWNLTGGAAQGAFGNMMVFDAGGVKLTTTAWSYTLGTSNNALESAGLGQWSLGLGVRNREEPTGAPEHQVSNQKANDFVLFVFDELVEIENVVIRPSGTYDRDVTCWTGLIDPATDLTGVTYAGLAVLGFDARQDHAASISSAALTVPVSSPPQPVNALLFGARIDSDCNDYFKITSITATVVPEPSALLLGGLGLAGLCLRRRR